MALQGRLKFETELPSHDPGVRTLAFSGSFGGHEGAHVALDFCDEKLTSVGVSQWPAPLTPRALWEDLVRQMTSEHGTAVETRGPPPAPPPPTNVDFRRRHELPPEVSLEREILEGRPLSASWGPFPAHSVTMAILAEATAPDAQWQRSIFVSTTFFAGGVGRCFRRLPDRPKDLGIISLISGAEPQCNETDSDDSIRRSLKELTTSMDYKAGKESTVIALARCYAAGCHKFAYDGDVYRLYDKHPDLPLTNEAAGCLSFECSYSARNECTLLSKKLLQSRPHSSPATDVPNAGKITAWRTSSAKRLPTTPTDFLDALRDGCRLRNQTACIAGMKLAVEAGAAITLSDEETTTLVQCLEDPARKCEDQVDQLFATRSPREKQGIFRIGCQSAQGLFCAAYADTLRQQKRAADARDVLVYLCGVRTDMKGCLPMIDLDGQSSDDRIPEWRRQSWGHCQTRHSDVIASSPPECERLEAQWRRIVAREREFQKKCSRGNPIACTTMGLIRESEDGKPDAAVPFYRKSCDAGNGVGCFFAGAQAEQEKDFVKADKLLRKGCNAGGGFACTRLALLHRTQKLDHGLDLDAQKELLLKGCRRGSALGCTQALGLGLRVEIP